MATVLINIQNIIHNAKWLKSATPGSKIFIPLSADGFGHGAETLARVLEPMTDGFAVGRPSEAFDLRSAGILKPILVLNGFWSETDLHRLSREACDVVIHSDLQIRMLESIALQRKLSIWLELDLDSYGMGLRESAANHAYQRLVDCLNVRHPLNLLGILSAPCGSNLIQKQMAEFDIFSRDKKGAKCLIDYSKSCSFPNTRKDIIKIGQGIYGICHETSGAGILTNNKWILRLKYANSQGGFHKSSNKSFCSGLRSAMTLKARILATRYCDEEDLYEYLTYDNAPSESTVLGVVSIGYGDGYPSRVPEGTPMWVNGRLCTIVNQPRVDTTLLDLGVDSKEMVGDEVVCWGDEHLPIELLAAHVGVPPYSLCCMLTKRVTRQFGSL